MTQTTADSSADSFNRKKPRSSAPKWLAFLVTILLIGGGVWYYFKNKPAADAIQFRTVTVARGEIVQEVTANGSLSPVKNVEVGSQVSGIIDKINVDFNSHVNAGDVIAQIDPSTYQQNLVQAEAELANSQAALELAEINARRADELFKDKLISAAEHDSTVAAFHQAQAVLKTREAPCSAQRLICPGRPLLRRLAAWLSPGRSTRARLWRPASIPPGSLSLPTI